MSGHSKWSKVKHQKAVTDAVKGHEFTKASRAITIAVKEGGGITDPTSNFRLRLAIEKAKGVNMPKDNIERAIERGKSAAGELATIMYEGYGPGGVAVLAQGATDNKQRTSANVKYIFDRGGGSLGGPGSVAYLFRGAGVITIEKKNQTLDAILVSAVEAGADDVEETDDYYEVYTEPHKLHQVQEMLTKKGLLIDNAAMVMRPQISVAISEEQKEKLDKITQGLNELEDIVEVYTNHE